MELEHWDVHAKTGWGDGPWMAEPDKVQWIDAATELPCLAVRGPVGAWCGYVGVPPWHPWHGLGYDTCPVGCGETFCGHRPDMVMTVHGGLTFAGGCSPLDRATWEKCRQQFTRAQRDQVGYPRGDAAEYVRTWAPVIDDYDSWRATSEGRAICHKTAGEDSVWWFGWDACHAGDVAPKILMHRREFHPEHEGLFAADRYRDLAYAKAECAELARQLVGVAPLPPLALPAPA